MAMAQRMRLNNCNNRKLMLLDLPSHILVDILLKLPCESVCCLQCVSKALLKLVDDEGVVPLHSRLLTNTYADAQVPQLMSFAALVPSERGGFIANLQPVKFDGSALTTRGNNAINVSTTLWRDSPSYMVDFVFCNLICFRDKHPHGKGVCFLMDLCRREVLRLPKNDDRFVHEWYGMGFDRITNTLKIVRVIDTGLGCMVAQVLELGKSSWRQISSSPLCRLSYFGFMESPKNASAYGDMHWLRGRSMVTESREAMSPIISFDFTKEEFRWTPHPKIRTSREHTYTSLYRHLHLLTLKGSLALVDTSSSKCMSTNIDIWLMKDYEKKEWTRDYTIGIEMFYGGEFAWLIDVTFDEWEHGIFFKNFKNKSAVFLDLRSAVMNPVRCESGIKTKIFSYKRSFISLKDYGNLVEAEQDTTSLKSYMNLMEEEAQEGNSDIAHQASV